MIKHHKVHPWESLGALTKKQLTPIRKHIKDGVADSKESITLMIEKCDMNGAKRFDPQNCVLAQLAERKLHPRAISVSRSVAYLVFNGIAVRFCLHKTSRRYVDAFDKQGVVIHRPVTFSAPSKSGLIGNYDRAKRKLGGKRKIRKHISQTIGVRALDGGMIVG